MPVAWGSVRGQVVFDSAHHVLVEQASSGFSWMGSRALLITDQPAVYVHDTGGFGNPVTVSLDPATDKNATLELVDKSTRLVADLRLPGGKSTRISTGNLPREALTALTGLRGRLMPDAAAAGFVSPCAVSITPQYEAGQDGPDQPPPADPLDVDINDDADAAPPAELAAYVVITGGRLQLRGRGKILVEWPVNRVAVAPIGRIAVELRGGALLDGRFLTGAVLHLVTWEVQQAFLAAIGTVVATAPAAATAAGIGTSAPVTIRGLATGAGQSRVDCVLTETALDLQTTDSQQVLAHFDLNDPQLRIAGSAERFVVFTPAYGPVIVESASEPFGRRLHDNAELRAAAERTLQRGSYPAELSDGQPVACAFAADGMRVKGPGMNLRIPYQALRTVAGEPAMPRPALRLTTERADLRIVGQPELIQALHTEVRTWSNATATGRQIPDLLRAAVGLEEDYYLYTVFGPFYELHAAMLGDVPAADLGRPLTLPQSTEDRSRIATSLQVGLAELQRHLDQVSHVLPAFLRHRDAQLLAPATGGAEPDWLKAGEAKLRMAFVPVQRAAAETGQLAAQVARLIDIDPDALPKPSYAGAAVSLGAAALLNPVFAVSGLSQAYSQRTQGELRKAQASAQSERSWTVVLDRWNALLGTTLPVLGYVLTENVFAPRWDTARRIGQELSGVPADRQVPALRGVARRLATLDVMRRYPASSGVRLRRGEIADHLRAARDAVRTPRFVDF